MKIVEFATLTIAVAFVVLVESERIEQTYSAAVKQHPQPVLAITKGSQMSVGIPGHLPEGWALGRAIQFHAWPFAVPKSVAVYCLDDCRTEPIKAQNEKPRLWLMKEGGAFRVPIVKCTVGKHNDDWAGSHMLRAANKQKLWIDDEKCVTSVIVGYGYDWFPTKLTYFMDILYSIEGNSSGKVEQEVSYTYGVLKHDSITTAAATKVATDVKEEASVNDVFVEGKESASVQASVEASISSAWDTTNTFNMTEKKKISIDLSKPCYIYRVRMEVSMNNGTTVEAASKSLVQTTEAIKEPVSVVMLNAFEPSI